jgi:CheY-like chemotaxis protein
VRNFVSKMAPARRILLVEDDFSIRETITELLEDEGFRVTCAANGAEALERLEVGEEPGLILLDLMMPVMDGSEFRRAQRTDPRLSRIPVVVLSAGHGADRRAASLDVDAFLAKPFEVQSLLETVSKFV